MGDLITHLRNVLVTQADPQSLADEISAEALAKIQEEAARVKPDKLLELIEQFATADSRMRWAPNKKMHFEIAVIRGIQTLGQATLNEVLETLSAMKGGGGPTVGAGTKADPPRRPKPESVQRPARPAAAQKPAATIAETSPVVRDPVARSAPMPAPLPDAMRDEPENLAADPADKPVAASEAASAGTGVSSAAGAPSESAQAPQELWLQVIAEVRRRRPLISAWVEAGALISIEHETALVGFPPEQALAAEYCGQANNRKFLEGLLAEISGRELALKCQVREGLVVTPPPPAPKAEPAAPRDPLVEFKNDPLIQRALEIFRAEIQPA
jgi:DNA polymerase-3 subunit gamma/tau